MKYLNKIAIRTVKKINWFGSVSAQQLTRLTGKHSQPIHPKHLIEDMDNFASYCNAGDLVLDIGCQNGQRDFKFARIAKHVTGFDYDPVMLARAREEQLRQGLPNITFLEASAEEVFPFNDHSFDTIFFLDVIEHLHKRDHALREAFRVLKPGGRMIITAPQSNTAWKEFQRRAGEPYYSDPDHKIEYTRKEFEQVLLESGFSIQEWDPIVYDTPFPGLIDLVGGFSLPLYQRLARWKRAKAGREPQNSIGFRVVCERPKNHE